MKKYLTIYKHFLRISLRGQMIYRTNFILAIVVELFWVLSHLLYVLAIWKAGVTFPGFQKESALVFVGTYLILTGVLMGMFYTNLSSIPGYIHNGQMDLYLTKPISSQFMLSLQRVDFGYPIPDLIIGTTLLIIGWQKSKIACSFTTVGGYLLYLLMGIIWMYCFQMVPVLLSFFFVKTNGIFEVFYGLHDLNKVPMGIYRNSIRLIGTFLLPIFPMVNFPPMCVLGSLGLPTAIYGIIAPVFSLICIRALWKRALRKYTSANG